LGRDAKNLHLSKSNESKEIPLGIDTFLRFFSSLPIIEKRYPDYDVSDEKWMAETRYKYRQKPIPRGLTPMAQEEFDARCAREYRELGFDDRPTRDRYASREIDPYPYQNDNSGLYYQRTIVGPNAGQWSIQFISGPN
jgi:hypothetical protein